MLELLQKYDMVIYIIKDLLMIHVLWGGKSMLNIAVCDDDTQYCEAIKKMISDYCEKKSVDYQVTTFLSGSDFLLSQDGVKQFQVIYLDINMDGPNGIEVAEKLRQWCKDIYIVFVTSYIDFTLEGYRVEALRYIMKDYKTLQSGIVESLDAIFQKMHLKSEMKEFCFREGIRKIPLRQIEMVESNLHNLCFIIYVHSVEKKYTMAAKLNDIQEILPDDFVRIHQSYLVNIRYIKEVSNYQATLWTGKILPVARSKYRNLKERFLIYEGEF